MPKIISIALLFLAFNLTAAVAAAQDEESDKLEACTSIMAGRKATTDKSVITSHTCDGAIRTWLTIEPAADHADTAHYNIYNGSLKTETPWDRAGLTLAGTIPQVKHTYRYLNTGYPCLNEKQLGIGETTLDCKPELVNERGMFTIEALQHVVLQRCSTARDAIKLIGELVKQYGYGDMAECLTIADKYEVWQFEICGEGKEQVGAVWAAQRIPDDHVGISANVMRIGEIDLNNRDFFMASDNVKEVALRMNLWDGKSPFKFWKAYSDSNKPFTIREYFVFKQLAPSLSLDMNADELPFSIKPDKKVSPQEIFALFRSTYEKTEYDMTKNLKIERKHYKKDGSVDRVDTVIFEGANPWMARDQAASYNYGKKGTVNFIRTIAVAWCAYSHVIQLRADLPDEVGGVAWFSFDNPAQSPRIPIYSGNINLPDNFSICGQQRYRQDAAIWNFRKANKLATVRWQKVRNQIENEVTSLEAKALLEQPYLEDQVKKLVKEGKSYDAQQMVTSYSNSFARNCMQKWLELESTLWNKFQRGF